MPRDFFPFVEEGTQSSHDEPQNTLDQQVTYPARIAVYDDPAVTPRVVIVEPCDVRDFLANITQEVTNLSHEQGGTIPFTIIREIVENYIHAAFIEPTITILDGGNTIRFCDQGPGIKEKDKALQFGTTSATDDMKRYIRGVGSGLPIAQQYMIDKGGSLTIQDNISSGTIVTISTRPQTQVAIPLTPHNESQGTSSGQEELPVQNMVTQQMPSQVPTYQTYAAPQSIPQQSPVTYPAYQQPWQTQQATPYQTTQPSWPQPQRSPAYPQVSAYMPGMPAAQISSSQVSQPGDFVHSTTQQDVFSSLQLTQRGQLAIALLVQKGAVGGKDLVEVYGGSQPTWSRELKTLDSLGLTSKEGQKRQLTAMGKAYVASLQQ